MGKYDKFTSEIKEEKAFNKKQDRLHEKYEEIDEDKVIVETSNMTKFLLSFLKALLKTVIGIVVIILTTIGILTLIYPDSRAELFNIITGILNDIKMMIR